MICKEMDLSRSASAYAVAAALTPSHLTLAQAAQSTWIYRFFRFHLFYNLQLHTYINIASAHSIWLALYNTIAQSIKPFLK